MLYFGFIFFYKRRTQFLLFVGFLCMGNQPKDATGKVANGDIVDYGPFIAGLIALLDALLHTAVRMQHPEFDQSMQKALSDADDAAMGGESASAPPAGGGGQQYMPEQEDIYQAPAAPAPAPMYAPAPAPAPMYAPAPAPAAGIYGGDDGGTAI